MTTQPHKQPVARPPLERENAGLPISQTRAPIIMRRQSPSGEACTAAAPRRPSEPGCPAQVAAYRQPPPPQTPRGCGSCTIMTRRPQTCSRSHFRGRRRGRRRSRRGGLLLCHQRRRLAPLPAVAAGRSGCGSSSSRRMTARVPIAARRIQASQGLGRRRRRRRRRGADREGGGGVLSAPWRALLWSWPSKAPCHAASSRVMRSGVSTWTRCCCCYHAVATVAAAPQAARAGCGGRHRHRHAAPSRTQHARIQQQMMRWHQINLPVRTSRIPPAPAPAPEGQQKRLSRQWRKHQTCTATRWLAAAITTQVAALIATNGRPTIWWTISPAVCAEIP
jgi:hypothetical protein